MNRQDQIKLLGLFLLAIALVGCSPFNQDNLYGAGYKPSEDPSLNDLSSSTSEDPTDPTNDFQAYQSNFMTISVGQVLYSVTDTLSTIVLKGICFNPGFEVSSIYYKAKDANGLEIATDGLPYITNYSYYSGSSLLIPNQIKCGDDGHWIAGVKIPTAILYQLDGGNFDVTLVVWHKGKELRNDKAGHATFEINPPDLTPVDTSTTPAQ